MSLLCRFLLICVSMKYFLGSFFCPVFQTGPESGLTVCNREAVVCKSTTLHKLNCIKMHREQRRDTFVSVDHVGSVLWRLWIYYCTECIKYKDWGKCVEGWIDNREMHVEVTKLSTWLGCFAEQKTVKKNWEFQRHVSTASLSLKIRERQPKSEVLARRQVSYIINCWGPGRWGSVLWNRNGFSWGEESRRTRKKSAPSVTWCWLNVPTADLIEICHLSPL